MSDSRPNWAYSLPVAIVLMAPFDLLASLAMDIYLPVVPLMPKELGTSPEIIQLTLSLYLLGLGLGQIVFGPLSDRVGRRPVLLGGAFAFAIASAGLAISNTAAPFVALRIVQALGASAALVATFATVRDVYAESAESVTIYGLFSSILAFVPALAPILGSLVAGLGGWRTIFWLLSIISLPPLIHAVFRWHETLPEQAKTSTSHGQILKCLPFWFYTAAFGTAMGTFFVFFSTAPRILIGRAGYSEVGFSLAFASAALVMVLTARFAGQFSARWGIDGSIARGMMLMIAGALSLALTSTILPPGFVSIILPMWVMAIGIVLTVSVTPNGALAPFDHRAGLAVAVYFAGQSVMVAVLGTAAVIFFGGDSALPLIVFASVMPAGILTALHLKSRRATISRS